ncbi:unnamed protein product [Scytosiphon promiscuus]
MGRDRHDDRHRRTQSPVPDRWRSGGREREDSRARHAPKSEQRDDRKRARKSAKDNSRSRSRSRSRSSERERRRRRPRREREHSRSRSRDRSHRAPSRKSRWGEDKKASAPVSDAGKVRRDDDGLEAGDEDGPAEEEEAEPLPVTLFKERLMKAVRASQVLVCTGETGSGKTTQIPQYLLELVRERDAETAAASGADNDDNESGDGGERAARKDGERSLSAKRLLVAVTQPRRVAATSVARRVADERGCRLGEEVGYSIRFEDRTGPRTRIKYMTDGVLVRECLEDPYLSRYGVVMLDEAHERSIDTDILFGLLKRALARRPDLRAVITSATLDVQRFAAFFDGCPFISVPGRTHAVDVYHSKTRQVMTATGPASPHYVEDAVDIIRKVHRTQGPGHVLAFFTGQDEIERAGRLLSEAVAQENVDRRAMGIEEEEGADNGVSDLVVVPLFGALSAEAQANAFKPARAGVRKVVMATNIAETSVTVPGVRFVIDPGYVKQKTYDPARRMESLVVVPISQVAAQQRAGRAGRTASGQCYRLYTRDCYGSMLGETVPEILRTNLANTLLYLKVLGVDDILAFDFLDPPAEDQSLEALQHLYCLGALDQDGRATERGRRMSRFPLEPSLSRTLLEAGDLGCVEEVLTIVALLSVESICHALFRHPLGDHFTYLAVFRAWEASGFSDAWAKEEFLRVRALRTARSVRAQLLGDCGRDFDKVRKAFCAGYFTNGGQRCSKEWVFRSLAVGALQEGGGGGGEDLARGSGLTLMYLHPTSSLVHATEPPEHVIYTELVFTARPFMRHAMAVKGRWLRSRLDGVEPCSADRLCGRALASGKDEEATAPGSGLGRSGGAKKVDAVAAARARFLARKRTKG